MNCTLQSLWNNGIKVYLLMPARRKRQEGFGVKVLQMGSKLPTQGRKMHLCVLVVYFLV